MELYKKYLVRESVDNKGFRVVTMKLERHPEYHSSRTPSYKTITKK